MSSIGIMEVGPPEGRVPELSPAQTMGYLAVGSSMLWPRLGIIAFWIFGSQLGDAFDSWVVPVIGFILLPWTTCGYALMWGLSSDKVSGAEWIVVAVAFLLDVATWVGGRARARSR
jgi:hypothetical protein